MQYLSSIILLDPFDNVNTTQFCWNFVFCCCCYFHSLNSLLCLFGLANVFTYHTNGAKNELTEIESMLWASRNLHHGNAKATNKPTYENKHRRRFYGM